MAGYDPLPIVDRSLIDQNEFPPDVKIFATELMGIEPERRREIIRAMKMLAKIDFEKA